MTLRKKIHRAFSLLDFLLTPGSDIEVFGMFGQGNLGDEAMLVAARQHIQARRMVPCQTLQHRTILRSMIHRRKRPHLLVGGGTLIHGGDTGWLDYIDLRRQQNTEVSFFGTGVAFEEEQMTEEAETYRRWRDIMKRTNNIYLRGPHSAATCARMGVEADVFGDFAFLLHRDGFAVTDHGARSAEIGLNVGLMNLGQYSGDQDAYEEATAAVVKTLASDHPLVFHVVVNTDVQSTIRIISRAGIAASTYRIEHHYYDPNAFMESVRAHRAFIGLKLHAAGIAMVAGVPSLMIAYRPKTFDFMAPLGDCSHMIMDLPLDPSTVEERIAEMLERPDDFTVATQIGQVAIRQREVLGRIYGDAPLRASE